MTKIKVRDSSLERVRKNKCFHITVYSLQSRQSRFQVAYCLIVRHFKKFTIIKSHRLFQWQPWRTIVKGSASAGNEGGRTPPPIPRFLVSLLHLIFDSTNFSDIHLLKHFQKILLIISLSTPIV